MVSPILIRNENEFRELYEWLLGRAQEEESYGDSHHASLYREYADLVELEMNC